MASSRFADLRKVPKQPAARLVALANSKIKTKLSVPVSASVSEVMEELASKTTDVDAGVDMIRVMAMALPMRERVWWACMAARAVLGPSPEKIPLTLDAAEKWVRSPSDELREKARVAAEAAGVDDPTTLCATAVAFCDDKLGTGDLAQYDGPPGASQNCVFATVAQAISVLDPDPMVACNILVDRAVDIARGGNGTVKHETAKEPNS